MSDTKKKKSGKKKKNQWGGMLLMLFWSMLALITAYVLLVVKPDLSFLQQIFQDVRDAPTVVRRTDIMVCYEKDGHPYLANISYGRRDGLTETYGVTAEVAAYGIKPGDFAELTYEIHYAEEGSIYGGQENIAAVEDCRKLTYTQAHAKRTYSEDETDAYTLRRAAGANPVGIYYFPKSYSSMDFIYITIGSKYYLYSGKSDTPQIFDECRKVSKDVGRGRNMQARVLCQSTAMSKTILRTMYEGTFAAHPDMFFVGYESPYPLSVTSDGVQLPSLYSIKKTVLLTEIDKPLFLHITPENTESLNLPAPVQKALEENWNGTDHVLVYTDFGMTDAVSLSYDANNRLTLLNGDGQPVTGYYLFYIEKEFFQLISSGLASEQT